MSCTAKAAADGDWIVTVASSNAAHHENLAEAIMLAVGGLASRTEAEALAYSIHADSRAKTHQ